MSGPAVHKILAVLVFIWAGVSAPHALGAGGFISDCAELEKKNTGTAQTSDMDRLIACYYNAIRKINPSGDFALSNQKSQLSVNAEGMLRYTTALRNLLNTKKGKSQIDQFRKHDDLDSTSVLAAGIKSNDRNIRVNSSIILANTIDNSTICVVLDHIYDESSANSEHGQKGRANLMGVVRSVARWAYRENHANIRRMLNYVEPQLKASRGDSRSSLSVLDDLRKRLANPLVLVSAGTEFSKLPLPDRMARECKSYKPLWAGNRLRY